MLRYAEELGIDSASTLKKSDMVFSILKRLAETDVPITGEGVLEILQDGFGFLRSPDVNYVAGPDDVYVSPSQIRRFALRTGDVVQGQVRAPKEGERYFALLRANTINFDTPEVARHRVHFDNLTPYYPTRKLNLEVTGQKDNSTRIIEIVAPLGKGQRALIVAQPRTGKTMLMQNIAHAIMANHPEVFLIVLLIDERPEEVTDMQRTVPRRGGELDLRRARDAPRADRRDGDREGQAPGRARSRRRDPAGFDHPSGARLQHGGTQFGQGADRRRRRERVAAARSASSAPRATSRMAVR